MCLDYMGSFFWCFLVIHDFSSPFINCYIEISSVLLTGYSFLYSFLITNKWVTAHFSVLTTLLLPVFSYSFCFFIHIYLLLFFFFFFYLTAPTSLLYSTFRFYCCCFFITSSSEFFFSLFVACAHVCWYYTTSSSYLSSLLS
ncbi:hypothetical protein MANES_08G136911v8 [Manihot esculenta]|uniref:Uncharacterized protein n=1 Tax=Manihot esculenta TaxID=3983 RepID=A0ACB7HD39_MANES|nr:hypothetical protein MANES_08G136911v8 [Manihot esculenta]